MWPLSAIGATATSPPVSSPESRFPVRFSALLVLLSQFALSAEAAEGLGLGIERISGPGWSAEGVRLSVNWQGKRTGLRFTARRMSHVSLPFPMVNPSFDCREGALSNLEIRCSRGILHFPHPALDEVEILASFHWDSRNRELQLTLEKVRFADGDVRLQAQVGSNGWQVGFEGKGLHIQQALQRLKNALSLPEGMELTGELELSGSVQGGDRISAMEWRVGFREIAFADAAVDYLCGGLSGRWSGELRQKERNWRGEQTLELVAGECLTPFFYLGVADKPLTIRSTTEFVPTAKELRLIDLNYLQPDRLSFELDLDLSYGETTVVNSLRLQTQPFELRTLYEEQLQPVLAESPAAKLNLGGKAELKLEYRANGVQRGEIRLTDSHVETTERRGHGLRGLNGHLFWNRDQPSKQSFLSWEGGYLFGNVTLGDAQLDLMLEGDRAWLLGPAEIPLLDGSLWLENLFFSYSKVGPKLEFDGALAPVSMEAFSQAMGWPVLAGQLSGGIPGATIEKGTIKVDGTIVANLFGGWATVRNLMLEGLSEPLITLKADIGFKSLDLELLTSTFSFGKISGKLDGRIDDLYLENWKPVSFDAQFATPERDKSRRRISQRAVENISSLGGGGISGTVSHFFLGFFKEFGYDKLGMSCRLVNGVCEMDGVEAAKQGYYLVKGSGIPRIDILGFQRRAEWKVFFQSIEAVK